MSVSPTRHRPRPRPATCEDWNEDARTIIPDTRRTANSAVKRSSKPDISIVAKVGEDNTSKAAKVGKDDASDSGYFSQTAATVDSGGSSQRSRLGLIPLTVDTGAAVNKAKTTVPESIAKSATRKSPTKLPPTTTTSKDQGKGSTRPEGCKCPDCAPKKKPAVTPLELRPPQDYFTLHQTSRPRGAGPPSPQSARAAPPDHAQQIPIANTAHPGGQPPSAQPQRMPRPMSFHAGAMPEVVYYPQPQVYIKQQPKPVFVTSPTYTLPSYPPTSAAYIPSPVQSAPQNYQIPSPYEQPRPQPRQWPAESYTHPPRHSAMYEPPVIQYGEQKPNYPTGVPPQPYSQSIPRDSGFHREKHPNPVQEYYERSDDYYKMPPPPAPTVPSQQRPTIRHAKTTSAAHATTYPRRSGEELPALTSTEADVSVRRRTRRETIAEPQPRSRRQSLAARPSAGPPRASYTSAPNERILVERAEMSAKQRRRASYYGQDALEREAERYQYETNHAPGTATKINPTIDSVKLTRKNTQSQASVAGSHSSTKSGGRSREGSDVKPRSGVSSRVVAGPTDGDGLSMRFHAGVKVDVKGDCVEGRTITFQHSGDGDGSMELRIGGRKAGDEGSSERSDKARGGPNKPHSHSGASHNGTVSYSDLAAPSRSSSRMRRASMYSESAAPSRSASRMRRSSHLEEVTETLRPRDRSRRPSRSRELDDDAAFREKTIVSRSRRSSPAKEMEDVTITERRLVRTESHSGRSSKSGYSGIEK